ncbi:MAG: SAM-dependent methyltransferase [Muribaculaceae bacterium]|nr:SAM-dependent methyltransferase [Muribaculaceae bacterium]
MNNLINQIRDIDYHKSNSIIKELSGIVDYFSSEHEKSEFISSCKNAINIVCEDKITYGDWQTPISLAEKVCDIHLSKYGSPDIVIEPTCGLGAFVFSALKRFQNIKEIHAIEINRQYTKDLKLKLLLNALCVPLQSKPDIYIYNADFFKFDFAAIINKSKQMSWNVAVIGNPPWVTNSSQGKNNSLNVPSKKNLYGLKGIDAITGKSNFDISEYITLHLLKLFQINNGGISFLLKNSVIRNILVKQHIENLHIGDLEQRLIDALLEFNVSVDASCFFAQFKCSPTFTCRIFDFYSNSYVQEYGWVKDAFVSDTKLYSIVSKYDRRSSYIWRSGIKHDCASILELTFSDGVYRNGFGEIVHIEEDLIYPLLKSSDISKYKNDNFRKYVIVPQRNVGDDTSRLQYTHPLAFSYFTKHENVFSSRKSCIYKDKDKFSVFGIGDYSFKPYKIVISSLYKTIKFILVSPSPKGKPVIVDDTCYQLAFDNLDEARCILEALISDEMNSLLDSLVFKDAKRVITKSLLMRLDLKQLCIEKGIKTNTHHFNHSTCLQLSLFD